jgi:predicted Zn-dependent protease
MTGGDGRVTGAKWMRQGYITGLALALGVTLVTAGCSISTEKEVQMGEQYSAEIAKQLPLIKDPDVISYLTQLGGRLAKVADDRNLAWSFHLVDSKEINAFAIPGGFIYVNRGLVEHAENMSQLAGVLGHEIGHVTQRHSVKQTEMFEILLKERKERPDMVSTLFASHPLEEDRVKQARALIATYDASVLADLKKDDDDFHLFKQRVQALPPSPEPKKK